MSRKPSFLRRAAGPSESLEKTGIFEISWQKVIQKSVEKWCFFLTILTTFEEKCEKSSYSDVLRDPPLKRWFSIILYLGCSGIDVVGAHFLDFFVRSAQKCQKVVFLGVNSSFLAIRDPDPLLN